MPRFSKRLLAAFVKSFSIHSGDEA